MSQIIIQSYPNNSLPKKLKLTNSRRVCESTILFAYLKVQNKEINKIKILVVIKDLFALGNIFS